jgi:hypothetical protein
VNAIVYERLLRSEREPLTGLLSDLMGMIVMPYLGPRVARGEQARPAPVLGAVSPPRGADGPSTAAHSITSSTFNTVPDVPVGTFELNLPQGQDSALAATTNLCKTKLHMPTSFTAQNGAEIHQNTPITVTGCPKHKHKAKKANKAGKHGKK